MTVIRSGLSVAEPLARFVEEQVLPGLLIQAGWVVALLAVNQLLWVRGLRRHTAVGG